jgi:hypothetical protein
MHVRRLAPYVVAASLALTLGGCGSDDPQADPTPTTSPNPTTSPTAASSTPTAPESSATPTPSESATPSGGTSDQPAPLTPATAPLDWTPVPGPTTRTVTTSGNGWTLTVTGGSASLDGPDGSTGFATSGRKVSDALLDEDYAVVVLQDRAEQKPAIARVTDLETGKGFTIDARSDVPTTDGGTWSLGEGRLIHATIAGGKYCTASVDLASQQSTLGWCAPARSGFNGAHITPAGDSVLTFDDSHPSCRTVAALDGETTTPFTGVPECTAWDGLLIDDGAVWSVVPKEQAIESAHFYARAGDGYFDLGPGTSGSLTWCAGASYFVRDPQRQGDPAALMRWTPSDGLSVAYESPQGQAFLDQPRCGGGAITVSAFTSKGDKQVTASLS